MSPPHAAAALPLDASGAWCEPRIHRLAAPGPALFADRDGTVIELVPYLSDPAAVALIPEAAAALARANRLGIPVVMITNQSGVGRGYYGWADFAAVQARLEEALREAGARIDALYACPHPPRSLTGAHEEASCRKPNPGMLLKAAQDLNLELEASWVVGDALADIEAGKRAGLTRGFLVPSGYGARDRAAALALADGRYAVEAGDFPGLAAALDALAPGAVEKRGRAC